VRQDGTDTPAVLWVGHGWSWLAPTVALLMAGFVLLSKDNSYLTSLSSLSPARFNASNAVNQPHLLAYHAVAGHSEHNLMARTTFEWTNRSLSLSTAPLKLNSNGIGP